MYYILMMYIIIIYYTIFNTTGRVVGLEVSILRAMGSYPTQWTSMCTGKSQSLWDRVVG
jgi:hypothetical protein